eukprot:gb/GEZN01009430.1/.p1 GENE.gb/GEZN01009430.1/~~gb/GEZN01009430.1/.p1  ORF type:complete len:333 (-),score=41.69 gb/GEZN01009430.1/:283-1281(-)
MDSKEEMTGFDRANKRFMFRSVDTIHPKPKNRSTILYESAITVDIKDTLKFAYNRLISNNISSCPVMDADISECVGIFDLLTVVHWAIKKVLLTEKPGPEKEMQNFIWSQKVLWRTTTVGDIMTDYEDFTLNKGFSRYHAVETIATTNAPCVAILDRVGTVQGVLTQSMIISQLRKALPLMGADAQRTIASLITVKRVQTISENAAACEAFKIMDQTSVTGIAVVDDMGHLVDTISVRDLKAVKYDASSFYRIWWPVKRFKEIVRKESPFEQHLRHRGNALWVTEDEPIEKVIIMMATNHVHQVFVVKSGNDPAPIHIITQADVIRLFVPTA